MFVGMLEFVFFWKQKRIDWEWMKSNAIRVRIIEDCDIIFIIIITSSRNSVILKDRI